MIAGTTGVTNRPQNRSESGASGAAFFECPGNDFLEIFGEPLALAQRRLQERRAHILAILAQAGQVVPPVCGNVSSDISIML